MDNKSFYSHGKLLITGEYLVLKGADAFAIPAVRGQKLFVQNTHAPGDLISWESFSADKLWFSAVISKKNLKILKTSDEEIAGRLLLLLEKARELNPLFLNGPDTVEVRTELEFDREWGLGSSSTLISNIAAWANVNPYSLLEIHWLPNLTIHSDPMLHKVFGFVPLIER